MSRRVAVTGMGGVTALGSDWDSIRARLLACRSAVRYMSEWEDVAGLSTRLGAPVDGFVLPDHYTRKRIRSMGRVAHFSTRASELALEDAGLTGSAVLGSGRTGIAYGSCAGAADAIVEFSTMLSARSTASISATTYVRMMPHTTAVNTALFLGLRGRVIPTSSACTSGSQAIGFAYETIAAGLQEVMVAGGAEELTAADAAVFDVLYATSQKNTEPGRSPAPFDRSRDGLVLGEGGCTLILEEYEHARARGAAVHAEIVAFATNCDASHITQPRASSMQACMEEALRQAGLSPSDIGYVSAHGTATAAGDEAESQATHAVFGPYVPISSLKSYVGHTLGACGALEAWLSLAMQREQWFAPTLNLEVPDPQCAPLDHIIGGIRRLDCEYIMSNNFAFGGVNTSLVFRRL